MWRAKFLILVVLFAVPLPVWADKIEYRDLEDYFRKITRAEAATIAHYELHYNGNGFLLSEAMFGADGKPAEKRRIHRTEYKYNSAGKELTRSYYGTNGQPVADDDGIHRKESTYDAAGNETSWSIFGRNGQPVSEFPSIHRWECDYDGKGHITSERTYDIYGDPIADADGVFEYIYKEDEAAGTTSRAVFGPDRKPTVGDSFWYRGGDYSECPWLDRDDTYKSVIHRAEFYYNYEARFGSQSYYGVNGKPVEDEYGVHRYEWSGEPWVRNVTPYDRNGKVIEPVKRPRDEYSGSADRTKRYHRLFGPGGKPVNFSNLSGEVYIEEEGYNRELVLGYDKVYTSYFGLRGEPVEDESGVHIIKYADIDMGASWHVTRSFFDKNDKPALDKYGVHSYVHEGFEDEDKTADATFGKNGEPVAAVGRIHRTVRESNVKDGVYAVSYFGVDDKPVAGPDGYHRYERRLARSGRMTQINYSGVSGEPVTGPEGYSRVEYKYGPYTYEPTEESYWAADGKQFLVPAGYARITREFNTWGQNISEAYFGVHNEPVAGPRGYARAEKKYGTRCPYPIKEDYWGVDGLPFVNAQGYASCTRFYDNSRRIGEERYYGAGPEEGVGQYGRADRYEWVYGADSSVKVFRYDAGYSNIDEE